MTDFLAELAELAEKATPGPWQTFQSDGECFEDPRAIESAEGVPLLDPAGKLPFEREEANAALIVLLRNNLPTILAMGREIARTKTDTGRLLWRDDVEGICPSIDSCFEYGETVRCGPCATKAALRNGVEPSYSLPALPEVSRLGRENEAKDREIERLREVLGSIARRFPSSAEQLRSIASAALEGGNQ